MSVRPPLRVSVTRHEEKEQKLKEFVLRHLSESDVGAGAQASQILIVARSLDSPVVKAITGLTEEIAAVSLSVRLILAQVDREPQFEDWGSGVAFAHELRWAKHPRLIEAHEQLVLGPETCWIGDCMRRDPAKCDAYESFVEDCGEATGCATVSFERLWLASEPLVARTSRRPSPGVPGALPPSVEALFQPTVGTRH
jgi:hypothetical protein